jgi:cysteine-rich repeat protein
MQPHRAPLCLLVVLAFAASACGDSASPADTSETPDLGGDTQSSNDSVGDDVAAADVDTPNDTSETPLDGNAGVDTTTNDTSIGPDTTNPTDTAVFDTQAGEDVVSADTVEPLVCEEGFEDCNEDPSDGCEAELSRDARHCGECGNRCGAGPFGTAVCQAGRCALDCQPGRATCNASAVDGCEVDVRNSLANCGTCGSVCPTFPDASPGCNLGACTSNCLDGFEDCNENRFDGCEIDTETDDAHCGGCGIACGTGETCIDGACACTGTFAYVAPPTPFNSTELAPAGFTVAFACAVSASSIATANVHVSGANSPALNGTLAAVDANTLVWTASNGQLFPGDTFDLTIGAGLRSLDNLDTAKPLVIQGYVAASAVGSGAFVARGAVNNTSVIDGAALGDFDGDGDLDLATRAGLFLNDGTGSFGTAVRTFGNADNLLSVQARDLDGDGFSDVIVEPVAGLGQNQVRWGAATNPLSTSTSVTTAVSGQRTATFGDVDGDGDVDILTYGSSSFGTGTGVMELFKVTPGATRTIERIGTIGAAMNGIARLVDLDRDGDLDIVQANIGLERLFLNDGTGAFTEPPNNTFGLERNKVLGMAVGDLNHDGWADIVITNDPTGTNGVGTDQILFGGPDLSFRAVSTFSGAGPVRLADVDGDGDLDVVTTVGGKVAIFRNAGDGTFTGGATAIDGINAALGDIDGDGDIDLGAFGFGTAVTFYTNVCSGPSCDCGNGTIEGREACDDGPAGSASCDVDCSLVDCGDALINALAGEACDDGNDINTDGCTNTCVFPTCGDAILNQLEADVDCGGPCAACAPGRACQADTDCSSGRCYGGTCTWRADFEDGVLPDAMSTGGDAPWSIDASAQSVDNLGPIGGGRSLISGVTNDGTSSVYLIATFGDGGGIRFDFLPNFERPNDLVFLIDGVEVLSVHGRRLMLDDAIATSFALDPGTYTFEWRYEGVTDQRSSTMFEPYNRAWIDNIELFKGAP